VDRDDYADVLLLRPPQIGAASPSPA
jgi:hypothetical protein